MPSLSITSSDHWICRWGSRGCAGPASARNRNVPDGGTRMREVKLDWMFVEVMVVVVEADGVALVRAVFRNNGAMFGF